MQSTACKRSYHPAPLHRLIHTLPQLQAPPAQNTQRVCLSVFMSAYEGVLPLKQFFSAPTFTQNGVVEIHLDIPGSNPCWVIEYQCRVVYRMLPNVLDPNYASCPNFDGVWLVGDTGPGAPLCCCVYFLCLTFRVTVQASLLPRRACLRYTSGQLLLQ
jgi:hypothetical protein